LDRYPNIRRRAAAVNRRSHQNWNRDYDPQAGRYTESDRLGLLGGSLSTYAYVNNSPAIYVDPFGLCWLYIQSTGELLHLDSSGLADYFANGGYSGYGAGWNNPALQDVQSKQTGDPAGPIPVGSYVIGSP
jgi:RHS repeat-associated protein